MMNGRKGGREEERKREKAEASVMEQERAGSLEGRQALRVLGLLLSEWGNSTEPVGREVTGRRCVNTIIIGLASLGRGDEITAQNPSTVTRGKHQTQQLVSRSLFCPPPLPAHRGEAHALRVTDVHHGAHGKSG